jgi:hypothetical protein
VIWILGDLVGLPFLAVMLIQMMREDQAEAVAIDAELDAREAARARRATRQAPAAEPAADAAAAATTVTAAATTVTAATAGAEGVAGDDDPWWQADPRFTDRFKPPVSP